MGYHHLLITKNFGMKIDKIIVLNMLGLKIKFKKSQNIIPEIVYKQIFFLQITETLLEVTIPDSSIANPAAMNITKNHKLKIGVY